MKYNMYSIYDSKAGIYAFPFFQQNDAMAVRAFGTVAADPNTTINAHPGDFSVYRLGTWDDESGVVAMDDTRMHLCTGLDVLAARERVAVRDNGGAESFSKADNEGIN